MISYHSMSRASVNFTVLCLSVCHCDRPLYFAGKKEKVTHFILSIETMSRFCIITSKVSTNYPCTLVFNCLKGVSYFNCCVLQQ